MAIAQGLGPYEVFPTDEAGFRSFWTKAIGSVGKGFPQVRVEWKEKLGEGK